jgi:hypothetical protein
VHSKAIFFVSGRRVQARRGEAWFHAFFFGFLIFFYFSQAMELDPAHHLHGESAKDHEVFLRLKYIPQGRCGLLNNQSKAGLCTDNINHCIILMCSNDDKSRAILVHFDNRLLQQCEELLNVIKSVDPPFITLALRKDWMSKSPLYKDLLAKISSIDKTLRYFFMSDDDKGVTLSCGTFQIQLVKNLDASALDYHPLHRNLVAIRPLEVCLNKYASILTGNWPIRQLVIIMGDTWMKPRANEFDIDQSHEQTQKEISSLRKCKSIYELQSAIIEITETFSGTVVTDVEEHFRNNSFCLCSLEDYLCGYNPDAIELFKRNMRAALKQSFKLPAKMCKKVEKELEMCNIHVGHLLLKDKLLSAHHTIFVEHYERRLFYATLGKEKF